MSAATRARSTTLHHPRAAAARTASAPHRIVDATRAAARNACAEPPAALVPPTHQQPWNYRNRFTGTRPARVASAPALVDDTVILAWRGLIAEAGEASERVCAADRAAIEAIRAALHAARMPAPPAMRGWSASTARSRAVSAVWDRLIEASRDPDLPHASAAAIRRVAAQLSSAAR